MLVSNFILRELVLPPNSGASSSTDSSLSGISGHSVGSVDGSVGVVGSVEGSVGTVGSIDGSVGVVGSVEGSVGVVGVVEPPSSPGLTTSISSPLSIPGISGSVS